MLIPIAALATQWKFHGSFVGVAQDIPERLGGCLKKKQKHVGRGMTVEWPWNNRGKAFKKRGKAQKKHGKAQKKRGTPPPKKCRFLNVLDMELGYETKWFRCSIFLWMLDSAQDPV